MLREGDVSEKWNEIVANATVVGTVATAAYTKHVIIDCELCETEVCFRLLVLNVHESKQQKQIITKRVVADLYVLSFTHWYRYLKWACHVHSCPRRVWRPTTTLLDVHWHLCAIAHAEFMDAYVEMVKQTEHRTKRK